MSDRLRGDTSKTDIRKVAETASPRVRIRLLAVADAQHGRSDALVGLDHEVPGGTVARWVSQFLEGGLAALIDSDLATVLDGEDPEIAAAAALDAPPGLEKTALRAVAAACRGSSISELAQHHMAPEAEVEEWIALFVDGGAEALATRYRRHDWRNLEPGQAVFGRRKLPLGVSDAFLRNLHGRCDGDFARHLFAITLAYEGRTLVQIAHVLKVNHQTVSKWVNGFIRNGVAGIAPWRPVAQVPRRRDFTASSVAALAAEAVNQDYRTRLLAISEAYRAESLYDIARRHNLTVLSIRSHIQAFEIYGPMGLSSGEATLTPEMRCDYTAERLRAIAFEMTGDFRCQQRLEAMAQLYDGVSMAEASHLIGGLPAIRLMAERFNRFGHGITESFKSHSMAPKAPPPRPRPPVVRIKPPVVLEAMEMRADFDADSLAEFRDRLGNNYLLSLEIIIDTYNGITSPQIAQERGIPRANVTRILNTFNDRGLDWLLRALAQASKPERAVRQKAWKAPKEPKELRFPLRPDWDAREIRNAIYRTVDEVHRRELEVVLQVYQIGKVSVVAGRMETPAEEVTRIATDFNMHGETLGVESRLGSMLPADYDEEELRLAMRFEEPLRTYAQIVRALYGGKKLGYVRTTWELKAGELETIVRAYSEMGLAGLEADPLDARAQLPAPMPRKPAVVPKMVAEVSPPKTVASPQPPPEPQRPIAEPPKTAAEPVKVVANVSGPVTVEEVSRPEPSWPFPPLSQKPPMLTQPGVPHLPTAHPRGATLTDRLRSYARVARPPHDRALAAVLLKAEGGSVNSAARDLAMPPAEVETWINLYHRRGAKAFLGADRLSLHPLLPPDKGSEIKAMAQKTQDEIYEKRLLIVADSVGGDDMVSICERHGVAYDEAAECIVAYDRHGLAGLERVDTPALMAADQASLDRKPPPAPPPPPPPPPPQAAVEAVGAATGPSATVMFEGKNAHRIEAVREFHRNRNLQAVARQFNVSPATLENWLVAYVKTGMAERDRAASR